MINLEKFVTFLLILLVCIGMTFSAFAGGIEEEKSLLEQLDDKGLVKVKPLKAANMKVLPGFTVTPNQYNHVYSVRLSKTSTNATLRLKDLNGVVLYEQFIENPAIGVIIDIPDAGHYLISVTQDENTVIKKLIVSR